MGIPYDIIIPARYQSSRLPGKLLEDICGKTMIRRVIECVRSSSAERIIVAYDDDRIGSEVKSIPDTVVCKTSPDHPSGTDRVAEAVTKLGLPDDRIIVNVQGDEPMIRGAFVDRVAGTLFEANEAKVATAVGPLTNHAQLHDPNVVKCVIDQNGHALYFSRAPIPWNLSESIENASTFHHIGIYAYFAGYLVQHARREVCPLEATERLEQLRVLYNGDKIAVVVEQDYESLGVDTPQDLEYVRRLLANK